MSKVRNRRSEHGVRLTRVFHRQVGFDRAVAEDVCLDEDADGEVLVVAANHVRAPCAGAGAARMRGNSALGAVGVSVISRRRAGRGTKRD